MTFSPFDTIEKSFPLNKKIKDKLLLCLALLPVERCAVAFLQPKKPQLVRKAMKRKLVLIKKYKLEYFMPFEY